MTASPETLDLFGAAVSEFADGPRIGGLDKLTDALMRRFAEKGLSLAQLSDRRMMNMSERALKNHCRKLRLTFSDYTPPDMRTTIEFVKRGDFFEAYGRHAQKIAASLDMVVTQRDGIDCVGIPAHAFKDAKKPLQAAGFEPRKAPKKAVQHA